MFKVGDQVTRNNPQHPGYGKGHIVTETHVGGWFNHDGPTRDYSSRGGCHVDYWHLVLKAAPTSRTNDPATSKGKRKVNKYEQAVLNSLTGRTHGMTGKDIAYDTGHPLNCITPRFAPLRRKGLIAPLYSEGYGHPIVKRDKQIVWVLA